jgi:hypothetical protein
VDIGPDSLPPLVAELKRKQTFLSKIYAAAWRKLPAAVRAVAQIDPDDTSVFSTFFDFVGADYLARQVFAQHLSAKTWALLRAPPCRH